jgi:glycosyltransferase involved in cell wall biosynthesis
MSRSQPLVSCIMPTADRRSHVVRAVQFFVRQDHPSRELVIVDDGADPVSDLARADARIRYVRLATRASIGEKRNMACAAARGSIIAHWDDDDWYGPQRLSRQVACLRTSGAAICGLRRLLYLSTVDGRAWRYEYPRGERPWLAGNTLSYHRQAWERHPFAETSSGEDTRFVWSFERAELRDLDDGSWHVGIVHGANTAAIDPTGPWWRAADPEEARLRLGDDRRLYEPAGGPAPPATPGAADVARSRGHRRVPAAPAIACDEGTGVAVVVTCHAAYLPWLGEALGSIERQAPAAAERVVVLDGCEAPPRAGWRAVAGAFGDPSPARDAGLAATTAPWVVFWDADNVMPPGYLEAVRLAAARAQADVGILYPDLQHCDGALAPTALRRMPDWDYWELRAENFVDTAAAWRREALAVAGSWPRSVASSHEDYALALELTSAGWRGQALRGPPVLMREHGAGRNLVSMRDGRDRDDIWRARSLAVVTLVAPRPDTFERWRAFLLAADLPPKTSLYVVDNTGDRAFGERIREVCGELQRERGLRSVDVTAMGDAHAGQRSVGDGDEARHRHVARLYGAVLRRVTEDFVLTLEDDVEPPPDAVRMLGRAFGWERVGAVGAAYAWPGYDELVCAGTGDGERWGEALRWSTLPDGLVDVSCVGGGCTMWARWALRGQPVQFRWHERMGWDAVFCRELRRRGYAVRLHGGVRCVHHVHGELGARRRPQSGRGIAPHRPTSGGGGWVSDGQRRLAATGEPGARVRTAIGGWLLLEDALKLYELAYCTAGDVLELGSHAGLSASILAGALAERGLPGRVVLSVDVEPNATAGARRNLAAAGLAAWASFACEDAAVACRRLAGEGRRFDLVFVDHSHAYRDVAAVCRELPALVAADGYCLFHDFGDGRNDDPRNDDYDVVRAVADALDPACFHDLGVHGCSALYRRR